MRGKRWETLGLPGTPPVEDAAGEESASEDAVDAADDAEAAAFRETFDGEAKTASEARSGKGGAAGVAGHDAVATLSYSQIRRRLIWRCVSRAEDIPRSAGGTS